MAIPDGKSSHRWQILTGCRSSQVADPHRWQILTGGKSSLMILQILQILTGGKSSHRWQNISNVIFHTITLQIFNNIFLFQ
jgi:hypothetical protein